MNDHSMKVAFVGDAHVGKTSLVAKWQGLYYPNAHPTIGAAYATGVIGHGAGAVRVRVWDTAGEERYRSLLPIYVREADVVVIVFAVTDVKSFAAVQEAWVPTVEHWAHRASILLAGNKNDLDAVVNESAMQELVAAIHARACIATSAHTGAGVEALFEEIGRCPRVFDMDTSAQLAPLGESTPKPSGCCHS
jgi:small GTP-binding protein